LVFYTKDVDLIRPPNHRSAGFLLTKPLLLAKMIGVRHRVLGDYEGQKNWSIKIGS
jgi:hypothetical protein